MSRRVPVTPSWSLELEQPLEPRVEYGDLVLTRPGFTLYLAAYVHAPGQPPDEALATYKTNAPPERFDEIDVTLAGGERAHAYRLDEQADNHRRPGFYGVVVGARGHVELAVYFDDEEDVAAARALWRSLREARGP
jgi:hypothetical protein